MKRALVELTIIAATSLFVSGCTPTLPATGGRTSISTATPIQATNQLDLQAAETYVDRGNARVAQDDVDGAIQDYTQAIELVPQYAQAYNNRGNAHSDQGDLATYRSDVLVA